MRLAYDFHLHSCLSPCGSPDMSPYNLVNMAKLLGLDIIALTDHNTAGNCRAAMTAGEAAGIIVIPGMELCTAEEIHVVCLFPGIDEAEGFATEIRKSVPPVKNKPQVFGEQIYMDEADNVLGHEDVLLVTACGVTIDEVPGIVGGFGGFCYPAHIDRASFSVLSSLGDFPPGLGFVCVELTPSGDAEALRGRYPALQGLRVMRSSDAHYLENMREAADFIEPPGQDPASVVGWLRATH